MKFKACGFSSRFRMLPLYLNVESRRCVVIGGGPVGQRKAQALLDAGARVRVVCLEPPAMSDPHLEWLTEGYRLGHLDGACLVFTAATAEVNSRVIADAHQRGLWANSASDPSASDFYLPSIIRRGDFVLAVGTTGAAPSLSRKVRERLEAEFDEAFGVWVRLLGELRPQIIANISHDDRRQDLFERLSDCKWLEHLRREGEAATRAAMKQEVRRLADGLIE